MNPRFIPALTLAVTAVTVLGAEPQSPATDPLLSSRTVTHIGMVARSASTTSQALADLLTLTAPTVTDGQQSAAALRQGRTGTRVAELRFDNLPLEIIEPSSKSGPWSEFLSKTGEGIHHLAFEVPDVESQVRLLESKGGKRLLGKKGGGYALLDTWDLLGVNIELTQSTKVSGMTPQASAPPPDPVGTHSIARIGIMHLDTDKLKAAWEGILGIVVAPAMETAGRALLFPDDFQGDPKASNRETYVPLQNMWVNLIQPVGGKSPWRDLADRHTGAHYINFFVDDVNGFSDYLVKRGGKRILGNAKAPYSYVDMHEKFGGLTVLLLGKGSARK